MFWKPTLTLIIIIPFLTELLTTNIPAPLFFHPLIFLILTTVIYGFPVLLIRELAYRWKLGINGIFLLGFGYGIYNEGIIAKTILLQNNVPLPNFNNYGYFLGINFTWMIFICIWHTLFSVLFPLLIIRYIYPDAWDKQWLTPKVSRFISIPVILFAILTFFKISPNGVRGDIFHLIFFTVIIYIFSRLAKSLSTYIETIIEKPNLKPFLLGISVFIFQVFIPIILAQFKIPILLFIFYELVVVYFYIWFIMKKKISSLTSFILLALGSEIAIGLFGLFVGLSKKPNPIAYIVHIILLGILILATYKIKKKNILKR